MRCTRDQSSGLAMRSSDSPRTNSTPDRGRPLPLANAVDQNDVGVLQTRDGAGFKEALAELQLLHRFVEGWR